MSWTADSWFRRTYTLNYVGGFIVGFVTANIGWLLALLTVRYLA